MLTDAVLDALACARLTRLITRDTITDRLRWPLIRRSANGELPEWVGEFVRCPWCVSIWVAFGIVAARRTIPRAWAPVAAGLAASEVASLTALARHAMEAEGTLHSG